MILRFRRLPLATFGLVLAMRFVFAVFVLLFLFAKSTVRWCAFCPLVTVLSAPVFRWLEGPRLAF